MQGRHLHKRTASRRTSSRRRPAGHPAPASGAAAWDAQQSRLPMSARVPLQFFHPESEFGRAEPKGRDTPEIRFPAPRGAPTKRIGCIAVLTIWSNAAAPERAACCHETSHALPAPSIAPPGAPVPSGHHVSAPISAPAPCLCIKERNAHPATAGKPSCSHRIQSGARPDHRARGRRSFRRRCPR